MEKLGATNARQLADALGMTDIDRERRVARWVSGESTPRFVYTMEMLSKAGLLTAEAERVWLGQDQNAPRAARVAAEHERQVSEQAARLGRAGQSRRKRETG
jgi:hypothetical protein